MSRRDTILIAVLINCALLAVLFMMAFHIDTDQEVYRESPLVVSEEPPGIVATASTQQESASHSSPLQPSLPSITTNTRDELDRVLQNYTTTTASRDQESHKPEENFVEITVKHGDYLEKIAKANGTTVKAIMEANRLPSIRIDIGQVLRVPVGKVAHSGHSENEGTNNPQPPPNKEPQYYTLKSGDNPWKVAKQFHVRFNELLSLNDLDEERARNLQPGDVLRVQ